MDIDDLYRFLRGAHVKAQGVVDSVRDPLLVLDGHLCVESANRAFYEAFEVGPDETVGELVYELGDGQWDVAELRLLLEDVVPKSRSVTDYEVHADFPGIGERTMLVSARRLSHPQNKSRMLLLTIVDATERRHKEKATEVFIGELQHRMKNLLALVHALARQTETADRSSEQFRDEFLGRLEALRRSIDTSAYGSVAQMSDLVARTLEPYANGSAKLDVEAQSEVALSSAQALPVAMIVHELATNAMKHGALSRQAGAVRIGWAIEVQDGGRPHVHLWWRESGGPQVSPPQRRGFGLKLIDFAATQDLGGQADLSYAPEGLNAEVTFPL